MATKSIIKVDVDSTQFKEFYALYQEYEERLSHAPEEWKKIDTIAGETHAQFAAAAGLMSDAMLNATRYARELSESMRDAIDSQSEFGDQAERSSKALSDMSKHAKDVGKSVFGIGKFLMGMTGLNIGVSALSAFGLDKLAAHAVGNQREASGLGMTTGQYRAFDTDLGRYLNPDILGRVADAQNSYTGRFWLAQATGISPSKVTGMDPGALAAQMALKAHDWWASTPESKHTTEQLQGTGFLDFMSIDTMRRLHATPRSQLEVGQAQYRMDSQALNIGSGPTNAMYDFMRQVTLAGQKLETSLTDKLSLLAPSIGNLVSGLEKDAEILLNNIFTEKNVNDIAAGIDTFTKYMGSQEFRDGVVHFVDSIKSLADTVVGIAKALKPDDYSYLDQTIHPEKYTTETLPTGAVIPVLKDDPNTHPSMKNGISKTLRKNEIAVAVKTIAGTPDAKDVAAKLGYLEHKYDLPDGLLSATMHVESRGKLNAVSNKGALGPFQLEPGTAKQYGVTNPFDFGQSAEGAAHFYSDLFRKYGSNRDQIKLALAGYNWGPGNVDADLEERRKKGGDWLDHAPSETLNQIRQILERMSRNQGSMKLTVDNRAGANLVASTNAGSI